MTPAKEAKYGARGIMPEAEGGQCVAGSAGFTEFQDFGSVVTTVKRRWWEVPSLPLPRENDHWGRNAQVAHIPRSSWHASVSVSDTAFNSWL